jgi:hypothetical protein
MMESVNKTTVGKNNVIRVIDGDGDDNRNLTSCHETASI